MHILPVKELAHFKDAALKENLEDAQWEATRMWLEFEAQATEMNLNAWREAWDYADAVYSELAARDTQKMLTESLRILAPRHNGEYGHLGGVPT